MRWTRIAYGMLAAAGVATTGTLVFWRSSKNLQSQDAADMATANIERAIATRYLSTGGVAAASCQTATVAYARYDTNDPIGRTWIDGGATNTYKAYTAPATNVFVFTNLFCGTFRKAHAPLCYLEWTNTGARYIRGPYATVTVTAASVGAPGGLPYTGTYVRSTSSYRIVAPDINNTSFPDAQVRRVLVQEYTKVHVGGFDWTILEYTGTGGGIQPYLWDTNNYPKSGVSRWYEQHGSTVVREGVQPHTHGFLRLGLDFVHSPENPDSGYGPWDNFGESAGEHSGQGSFRKCSMTGIGLTTSTTAYLDAACFEPVVVRDAIPGQIMQRDYYAWATNLQQLTAGGDNLPGRYVDDTRATGGVFVGYADALPEITTTGLWSRLAIGNRTNLWTHDMTNSYVVTLTNWTELYRVANALRWTHVNGNGLAWELMTTNNFGVPILGTPIYQWDSGWTDTLANAKAGAGAATPTISTGDVAPYATANLSQQYDWSASQWVFRATFEAGSNTIQTLGLCTNIAHDVDFYVANATPDDAGYNVMTNGYAAYSSGVSATGALVRVATLTSQWGETNAYGIGTLAFSPGAWPGDPSTYRGADPPTGDPTNGLRQTRCGWRASGVDTVEKWHFSGATNAP